MEDCRKSTERNDTHRKEDNDSSITSLCVTPGNSFPLYSGIFYEFLGCGRVLLALRAPLEFVVGLICGLCGSLLYFVVESHLWWLVGQIVVWSLALSLSFSFSFSFSLSLSLSLSLLPTLSLTCPPPSLFPFLPACAISSPSCTHLSPSSLVPAPPLLPLARAPMP